MNLRETAAVMDILSVAYPQFYKNQSQGELLIASKLWAEMFADDDVRVVLAAVKAHIATDAKGFPPNIGAIKTAIVKLKTPEEMTEAEAWACVSRACRNSIYNSQAEFDKLPPIVQRLVGSPNQLKEWAMMDADELGTVVASNFQRSFRARAQSERETMALPDSVREFAGMIASRHRLMIEGE